jgi:hypothetical protein
MGKNKIIGPRFSVQDIFINGLVDFLQTKYTFAYRNRGPIKVTFFYGNDIHKLQQYSLLKTELKATLPFNTIIKILKDMTGERPPSDDLQKGEQDPIIPTPTHFKYVVSWMNKEGKLQETVVGSEDAVSATKIISEYYRDFSSHVSTRRQTKLDERE